MKRKRQSKRKKCMTRTNYVWKSERKTDTKVKREGRENMKHKFKGTTSTRPSMYGHKLEGKEYYQVRKQHHNILKFHQIPIAEFSPFHHLSCCTISPYWLFYNFIISPYKLSHHINQHFYQCNILPDYISGCSEASYVDTTEPDYMSAAKKYENSLNITPGNLDKFPILNANKKMTMQDLKCSSNLVDAKPSSAIIIVLQVVFVCLCLELQLFGKFQKNTRPSRGMHVVHIYV